MTATTRQIVGANGQILSIVVVPNAAGTAGDAQLVGLTDGTNTAAVTAAGAQKVDGSGVTQPISATSLPLPSGAATDGTDSSDANATQATGGAGSRGWLSTLVSLFRAGTAQVAIRLLTVADQITTLGTIVGVLSIPTTQVTGTAAAQNPSYATANTSKYRRVSVDISVTELDAGLTAQYSFYRLSSDGATYFHLGTTTAITGSASITPAVPTKISASFGEGTTDHVAAASGVGSYDYGFSGDVGAQLLIVCAISAGAGLILKHSIFVYGR